MRKRTHLLVLNAELNNIRAIERKLWNFRLQRSSMWRYYWFEAYLWNSRRNWTCICDTDSRTTSTVMIAQPCNVRTCNGPGSWLTVRMLSWFTTFVTVTYIMRLPIIQWVSLHGLGIAVLHAPAMTNHYTGIQKLSPPCFRGKASSEEATPLCSRTTAGVNCMLRTRFELTLHSCWPIHIRDKQIHLAC